MSRILNIGSLNIDRTYQVQRFVQPKETIKAVKYEEFCGGKGLNQSVALARAGAEVYHAGAVGGDGGRLLKMLERAGVRTLYVRRMETVSGHAVIQVDVTGQNNIIICEGANGCVTRGYIDEVLEHFSKGDFLLVQNEVPNVGYAMERAKERGMMVAFNPSPFDETIAAYPLELVDYFLLNEVEGGLLAGVQPDQPEAIVRKLREIYKKAAFVLTLGEGGAYFFDQSRILFQEIYRVQAVDTTGAGDTFCGYFMAGVIAGLEMGTILKQASAASAISVSRKGAAPSIPDRWEVLEMLEQDHTREKEPYYNSADAREGTKNEEKSNSGCGYGYG